jgi:hypothetical protein
LSVYNGHRWAGVIGKQLLAGAVGLAHEALEFLVNPRVIGFREDRRSGRGLVVEQRKRSINPILVD